MRMNYCPLLQLLDFTGFHWVSTVWARALDPIFMYPDVSKYGWNILDGGSSLEVQWDTEENIQNIWTNVKIFNKRMLMCQKPVQIKSLQM